MALQYPGSRWLIISGYDMMTEDARVLELATPELSAELEDLTGPASDTSVFVSSGFTANGPMRVVGLFGSDTEVFWVAERAKAADPSPALDAGDSLVIWGYTGKTAGSEFAAAKAAIRRVAITTEAKRATRVNAEYAPTGIVYTDGALLLPFWTPKTADWDTEGTPVDSGVGVDTLGGAGVLAIGALAKGGYTDLTVTISSSPDDITYTELVAFTAVTAARTFQVVELPVTTHAYRYLCCAGTWGGTGSDPSVECFVGFLRS